jgi:hypothetical protein
MSTYAQNAQSQSNSRSRGSQSGAQNASSSNPALATIETWLSMNRPMMSAMTEINGRLLEHVSRANDEWIEFMTRRFNEDLAASQRLMECRTVEDVFSAYAELFQRAQRQYQTEIQSFARLNQELADDTANLVKSHIEATQAEIRH